MINHINVAQFSTENISLYNSPKRFFFLKSRGGGVIRTPVDIHVLNTFETAFPLVIKKLQK